MGARAGALIRGGGPGIQWRSCGTLGGCSPSRTFSEVLLKLLAGLEIRDTFGGDIYGFAGLGIAAATRTSFSSSEAAKAAQLDLFTFMKRADYRVEDGFDYYFGIALVQLSRPSHFLHKFCLSHLSPVRRNGSAAVPFDFLISRVVAKK